MSEQVAVVPSKERVGTIIARRGVAAVAVTGSANRVKARSKQISFFTKNTSFQITLTILQKEQMILDTKH